MEVQLIYNVSISAAQQSDLVIHIFFGAVVGGSFPGGTAVKNPPANAGSTRVVVVGSVPGSERSPGVGNGNPLQYSCLENSMDREAWWATVCGVAKSQTRLSTYTHTHSFSYYFPLWFITEYCIQFPVLHSRIFLFIYSLYNSVHLLIPDSQFFPSSPPWQTQVCPLCP